MNRKLLSAAAALVVAIAVQARGHFADHPSSEVRSVSQAVVSQSSQAEVAFSPDAGSEALVLKVIDSTSRSLYLAGYSFTLPAIVKALLNAKSRGVDVQVVVDEKGNKSKASTSALNLLVGAKIPTRTISVYAIHHDKYIVADEETVETGSFNYSKAAATSNSENVLVVWKNPQLATAYLEHWRDRWSKAQDYSASY